MARPINDGTLSGAIGNVVFVNKGPYTYARSKPAKVKQTASTKAAASTFGWVSQQDKKFRFALAQAYPLITDPYYAARHRACMAKALNPNRSATPTPAPLTLNMPQAMEGFEFNTLLPWAKTCHFYLEFADTATPTVTCHVPALTLGENLKPPKGALSANINVHAFLVNPNVPDIDLTPISSHELTLQPFKTAPASLWSFDLPAEDGWLLVISTVTFKFEQANVAAGLRGCSSYLYASLRGA